MSGAFNQKKKLIYIAQYLYEYTDENHAVTTGNIIEMLKSHGISAERKSIYSDIELLKSMGMDIEREKGRNGGTKVLSRQFELEEIKLLADIVQSSKFITEKKSYELINKLEKLTSIYERKDIRRNVYITNRIKSANESIFYSTDVIRKAIAKDKKISFKYFTLNADKTKKFHNENKPVCISPYAMQYENEKYYLIAYETDEKKIKHYRVDRMQGVSMVDKQRDGKEKFDKFDIAKYSGENIKMFTGKTEQVLLECREDCAGAIIDKFGSKNIFIPAKDGRYTVSINVSLSPTFYSWVFTFGDKISILGPETAVNEYKKQLTEALNALK